MTATAAYDGVMQRRPTVVPLVWTFLPYIAMSAIHVILLAVQSPAAGPTKLLLMPLLALPVLLSARRLRPSITALLLIAILFSWLGDGAGALFPAAPEVPLMLLFFGLAHVAYIVVFVRHLRARRMPWWALVYAAWWIAMIAIIGPHAGSLFIAVALYGLLLGTTAALSTRCGRIIAVGGAFFLASDSILAFRLFWPDPLPAWTSPAVMLTYTLGQGLIVAGALLAARQRERA